MESLLAKEGKIFQEEYYFLSSTASCSSSFNMKKKDHRRNMEIFY